LIMSPGGLLGNRYGAPKDQSGYTWTKGQERVNVTFLPTRPPEVEERLRELGVEGVRMPDGMALDELALRVLIAAEIGRVPTLH
jgi:hypothetical protein